jgi:TRAP-type C4-dicarboxylate transport system permease large subunit
MGYIGLPRHLAEWIGALGLSPFALIVALTLFFILLGCFLDGFSMVVLTLGVILPTVETAGIDLLWFGVFIVRGVEMAQITPPVGFNLFVLQGMTGRQITWITRHTLPMFLLMVVAILLIWNVPELITYLPKQMKMG